MGEYVKGNYSDWTDRTAVHDGSPLPKVPCVVSSSHVQYESAPPNKLLMQTDLSAATNELPFVPLAPAPSSTASVAHTENSIAPADAVQVVTAGDTSSVAGNAPFRVLGNLPDFALDGFPDRWTRIDTTTLAATNQPLVWGASAVIDTFNPMNSLLTNPALVNKTKNWTYFRGDLELMGVVSIPGNASGAYVICAQPTTTSLETASIGTFFDEQCMSFEHSTLLLCSASTNISMTLPFFSAYDANLISSPAQAGGWNVRVVCLSPLKTAIPSGITTGSITWYARLVDYKLLVPRWEGRAVYQSKEKIISTAKSLKANKTISRTAYAVQGVAEKLSGVPVIGQVASMVAGATGTIGAIADFFGFS